MLFVYENNVYLPSNYFLFLDMMLQEEESAVSRGLYYLLTVWRPQRRRAINAAIAQKGLRWVSAARIGRAIRRKLQRVFEREEGEERTYCGKCGVPNRGVSFRGSCPRCSRRIVPGRQSRWGGPLYWGQRSSHLNHRHYASSDDEDEAPMYRSLW